MKRSKVSRKRSRVSRKRSNRSKRYRRTKGGADVDVSVEVVPPPPDLPEWKKFTRLKKITPAPPPIQNYVMFVKFLMNPSKKLHGIGAKPGSVFLGYGTNADGEAWSSTPDPIMNSYRTGAYELATTENKLYKKKNND